jgi:uncharacterized cupredoxin-like copper-binding protein
LFGSLSVCALGVAGLVAGLGPGTGAALAHQLSAHGASATGGTTITVTAGKPSELAFKLSSYSVPTAGKVTFKITNRGVISHSFEICTTPTKTASANACRGVSTHFLNVGASATLVVVLKKGTYEFLCTVPGHAAAGMKGLLGVATTVVPPPPPKSTSTTATTRPGGTTTTTTAGTTCASPTNTTVSVQEFEYGFTISPQTFPCGSITVNMSNTGQLEHNFDIQGLANGAGVGAYLQPGQSTSMTLSIGPGKYTVICDVPEHATLGMTSSVTVTG